MDNGLRWIDEHTKELTDLSDAIWGFAEVGLKEIRSAKAQAELLQREGFSVRMDIAGMPSALVAEYGSGKPIVGYLGEYDALPGLSQKVSTRQDPVVAGGAGHGCGHNLLGVGAVASAIALKKEIEAGKVKGTVRYYGCPAEETLDGKVFMAKAGVFDDLDAAITWHPMSLTSGWYGSCLAMNSVRFAYYGRTAHAAASPHMGISALDAIELLNIGANYLREHIIQEARIHYVTLKGGSEPNVVPAYAEAWYYVRAPRRDQVEEIYQRVLKIAEGAALMTGARLEVKFLSGAYQYLPNYVLTDLMQDCLKRVGPPKFTPEEWAFARELEQSFVPGQKAAIMSASHVPPEYFDLTLHEEVAPVMDKGRVSPGSTDVGDVSWITPTGQITVASSVVGTAGHSWQDTVASGMSIGHKGMIVGAKAMALAGYELMVDPALLQRITAEFKKATTGKPYVSPLPEGLDTPPAKLEGH